MTAPSKPKWRVDDNDPYRINGDNGVYVLKARTPEIARSVVAAHNAEGEAVIYTLGQYTIDKLKTDLQITCCGGKLILVAASDLTSPQPDPVGLVERLPSDLTDAELAEIETRAKAATPGPWSNDTADDPDIDFKWQQMHGPDGKVMFDSLNSDAAVIHEEHDEDGGSAWDETARRNFEHIAGLDPQTILRLVEMAKRGRLGHGN